MTIRSFAIVVAIFAALVGLYLLFTRVCGCSGGVANSPWLAVAWFGIALFATALSSYAPGVEVPTDPELFKADQAKRAHAMWMMLLLVAGLVVLAVFNFLYDQGAVARKAETAAARYKSAALRKPIVWAKLRPDENDQNGQLLARAIVQKKDRSDPLCY
jgi:hypothetical protein